MFGKKVLSLIGLLFLGSQISSVSAGCEPTHVDNVIECSSCDSTSSDGLHLATGTGGSAGTNILVKVSNSEATATCEKVTTPGYYLLGSNYYSVSHDGATHTNLGNSEAITKSDCDDTNDVGSLVDDSGIKICAIDSTTRAEGAITVEFTDGDYYLINVPAVNTFLSGTGNVIVSVTSNAITKVEVGTNFHYVISGVSGIGTLGQQAIVNSALDAEATLTGTNKYLVINGVESIKAGSVGKAIIVDNTGALDQTYNDAGDICLDTTTNIVTTRPINYCGASDCQKYYSCADDICTETTTTFDSRVLVECDPITKSDCEGVTGDFYYISSSTGATEDTPSLITEPGTPGNLYNCRLDDGARAGGCTKITDMAGYIKNNDVANGLPYIRCTPGASITCEGLIDIPDTKGTDVSSCTDATGYVLIDGTYKKCTDDNQATTVDVIKTSCTTSGQLINNGGNYEICVKQSNNSFDSKDFSVLGSAASNGYLIDATDTSGFNDVAQAGFFVAVTVDAKKAIVDTSNTPKKYLYAKADTREIKAKGVDASMCTGAGTPSLDTSYGHEFGMTKESGDHVNYYKDNNA